MSKVFVGQMPYSVMIRGKIGSVGDPDPYGINGIYQMRMCIEGKIPIKMKFYVPYNPETIPQQSNRTKFGEAVHAWQDLTYLQKQEYNRLASGNRFTGYHLFIRQYMLS